MLTTKIGSKIREPENSGYKSGYSGLLFGHPNIDPDTPGLSPDTPDQPVWPVVPTGLIGCLGLYGVRV